MISPENNFDQLVQRIRTAVAKHKSVAEREYGVDIENLQGDAAHKNAQREPDNSMNLALQAEPGVPREPAKFVVNAGGKYSLRDLTAFHDRDFVQNAYIAALHRDVDPDGLNTYLNLLRGGMAKLEILGILRNCEEGRVAGSRIAGLTWRYRLLRASRFPIMGRLVGFAQFVFELPEAQRAQRRFEGWAFAANETIRTQLNECRALLDEKAAKTELRSQIVVARSQSRKELDQQALVLQAKVDRDELKNSLLSHYKTMETRLTTKVELESVELEIQNMRHALESVAAAKADRTEITATKQEFDEKFNAALAPLRTSVTSVATSAIYPLETRVTDLRRHMLDQERRVGLLLEEARKRLPAQFSSDQLKSIVAEEDHNLDSLYASFEDRFRGTRSDIKQRQSIYLPYIRDANAGLVNAPVLDLGCGRGEWLELLGESALEASGVDVNRIFLAACREMDLHVTDQDVLSYLRSLKANSIGAVTSFHLIEHLPLKSLIAVFDESLRVLKPGGLAIFETPNPSNLVVGSCNFYFDPTHRNPMPAPLTQALLEIRGFSKTEILYLHPDSANQLQPADQPVQQRLNQLLYGPQDYAVLARKV